MANALVVIIALLVLALIVAILVPMAQKRAAAVDAFTSGIAEFDALAGNRAGYIARGKATYNSLSDTNDVRSTNFANATTAAGLDATNALINQATRSTTLKENPTAPTGLGTGSEGARMRIAPPSSVLLEAKKCEAVTGRSACARLGAPDFANCGVCIKEGTASGDANNPGKYMGGLLLLPEERQAADEEAGAGTPAYVPSMGYCPPGYFFADRATCEKEVNRLDCLEAGKNGGFNSGRTVDGRIVIDKCAQAPGGGTDLFVYETKGRRFNLNLRVLTPTGSGICKVIVRNSAGSQVGFAQNERPGVEFLVPIVNVKEGDPLSITVVEETPYRPSGKSEVFLYAYNSASSSSDYNQSESSAAAVCGRIGAVQATKDQLFGAWNNGAQICAAGWAKGFLGFPAKAYNKSGTCGTNSLNEVTTQQYGHSWCYGIKPPRSTNIDISYAPMPFFRSYKDMAEPSQADLPDQYSQNGYDYQAPYYRGVLMQWESTNGSQMVGFEPTILRVNGQDPSTGLRRMGTYKNSAVIFSPRPTTSSKMLTNQYWIWSAVHLSQQVAFDVQVPGTFLDPIYPEDKALTGTMPLVTLPATMNMLKTSACLAEDQKPGAYSIECLKSLYLGAGGDLYRGKLALDGLTNTLNPYGSLDNISQYLTNLYNLAAKGRTADGMKATVTEINDAAQKLFGLEMVSPCEDIFEDARGNIAIAPKVGGLAAGCLDYLWTNAGSDDLFAVAGTSGGSGIKPTYTTINDRYSGLRKSEGTPAERAAAPFAACTRAGTMAPVGIDGKENAAAIMMANSKGNIAAIQDYYNTLHKQANYAGANPTLAAQHTAAITQCYGINRAADKRTMCD